jgi:hypothetical protein
MELVDYFEIRLQGLRFNVQELGVRILASEVEV